MIMQCDDIVVVKQSSEEEQKSIGKIVEMLQTEIASSPIKVKIFQNFDTLQNSADMVTPKTIDKHDNQITAWVFRDCIYPLGKNEGSKEQQKKRKAAPRVQDFPKPLRTFEYLPSVDGVDENLLILLHGLGDSPAPYVQLARKMQVPQTACLCLQAPIPLPFGLGYGWFEGFDANFTALGFGYNTNTQSQQQQVSSLHRTRQTMVALVLALRNLGWALERILCMGFSQGGCVALDLALQDLGLGGVISIAGPLLQRSIEDEEYSHKAQKDCSNGAESNLVRKTSTPVLLISGQYDGIATPLQMQRTYQYLVEARPWWEHVDLKCFQKDHQMICSQEEMHQVMAFLGCYTIRRSLNLEASSDFIEL